MFHEKQKCISNHEHILKLPCESSLSIRLHNDGFSRDCTAHACIPREPLRNSWIRRSSFLRCCCSQRLVNATLVSPAQGSYVISWSWGATLFLTRGEKSTTPERYRSTFPNEVRNIMQATPTWDYSRLRAIASRLNKTAESRLIYFLCRVFCKT